MTTSNELTAAYILHSRDYRDTSQILDVLSLEHGRFSLLVRGARSAKSQNRGRLQPFRPILAGFTGSRELKTATRIETVDRPFMLSGDALLLGLYVNELLYRLLGRFDPVPLVYEAYEIVLSQLQDDSDNIVAIRRFELLLLQELGYGIDFEFDVGHGAPVKETGSYRYVVHEGFYVSDSPNDKTFPGSDLLQIAAGNLASVDESLLRKITRSSLAELLGDKPLKSRSLFKGASQ